MTKELMLTVFAAVLAVAFVIKDSKAEGIEVLAGQCAYKGKGEGEWWKGTEFESEHSRPYCGQIGFTSGGWRFAYTYLGKLPIHEIANGDGTSNPSHWAAIGHSEVQGLTAGKYWERKFWSLTGSAEFGAMLYDSHSSATAYHYASQVNRTVKTSHQQGIAPYLGLGVSYPLTKTIDLMFSARRYLHINFNRADGDVSSGDNIGMKYADVTTRLLGLSVKF